jgi:hypothetical protein
VVLKHDEPAYCNTCLKRIGGNADIHRMLRLSALVSVFGFAASLAALFTRRGARV